MENIHVILGAPKQEMLKPLLQKDGLVVGVDQGALFAIEENIHLDLALGDFDSVSKIEKEKIKENSKKIISNPTQDYTDTEIALLYIKDNYKVENIYIYNWYGGRVDHLYSLLLLVLQEKFSELVSKIHFISTKNYISYYQPGEYEVKKLNGMDYVSFILLSQTKKLTLKDVRYPLENTDFSHPVPLISNEFLKEKVRFSFEEGIIAVIQSSD